MADQKITQLTALVTASSDDLFPVVDDPGGAPVTKKITLANLMNSEGIIDGWVTANESWTTASTTTITVPTDATTKYSIGDRIRLKQGGAYKYFYIVAVAATTLTITGGTTYTLTHPAAITDNYYSKNASPVGFPAKLAYTATIVGFTTGTASAYFSILGQTCTVQCAIQATSNATNFTFTLPVACNNPTTYSMPVRVLDNSAWPAAAGIVNIPAGVQTVCGVYKDCSGAAFTNSNLKGGEFIFTYLI